MNIQDQLFNTGRQTRKSDKAPLAIKTISIDHRQNTIWVSMPDSLSNANCEKIEQEITVCLNCKFEHLVLDLRDTRIIYSSGIGMLIHLHKKVLSNSGTLCLVNVSNSLRNNLKDVKLDKLFTIYATDVEFEIARYDLWSKNVLERTFGFFFIVHTEEGISRIVFSGSMDTMHDLSEIKTFQPDSTISKFILDLNCLDIVDRSASTLFTGLLRKIGTHPNRVAAFGANRRVQEFLLSLPVEVALKLYESEKEAIAYVSGFETDGC